MLVWWSLEDQKKRLLPLKDGILISLGECRLSLSVKNELERQEVDPAEQVSNLSPIRVKRPSSLLIGSIVLIDLKLPSAFDRSARCFRDLTHFPCSSQAGG